MERSDSMLRKQTSLKRELSGEVVMEARGTQAERSVHMARTEELDHGGQGMEMLERMLERENMKRALQRVERNRGAAGVDGMTVEELREYLRGHWAEIREELLAGELSTETSTAGRDREARWRGEGARDTDSGGSIDPAGAVAGTDTDSRGELWVPAWA